MTLCRRSTALQWLKRWSISVAGVVLPFLIPSLPAGSAQATLSSIAVMWRILLDAVVISSAFVIVRRGVKALLRAPRHLLSRNRAMRSD